MAFLRVTLYSKICNINPLNKNTCFNRGLGTRVSPHCSVAKDIKNEEIVSVADYYSGKSIFITGGTGFLGKTYIQKVLYSCPKINKIYMLVRANSKKEAKHRVTEMIENSTELFNQIKEERPEDLFKLVPIVGDLSAPNLGIHPDEEILLREEVSVVVHSAASINITETLEDAFKINVTGTQNLLALAKRMKNLQAFLHISTIYCALTAGQKIIEEIVYPPPINLNNIQKTLEKYGHMRFPPENILGDKKNTYLFTKALSESMIQLDNDELPTAIIRPSLIGSSNIEPYKGWLDIMNIHSFLMYAMAIGHIRVLNIDKNTIWDFIPVDYVANLMILAATKCKRSKDIHVYNCASSFVNPVKISKAISIFISDFLDNKSSEYKHNMAVHVFRYFEHYHPHIGCSIFSLFIYTANLRNIDKLPFPFVLYIKSNTLFRLLTPILHLTPAHIYDLNCLFRSQKPKSVKSYRKLMELSENIQFYGGSSWRAKPDRVLSLISILNDEDRRNFPCDPNDIEWFEYFKKYSEGVRNYTLKN